MVEDEYEAVGQGFIELLKRDKLFGCSKQFVRVDHSKIQLCPVVVGQRIRLNNCFDDGLRFVKVAIHVENEGVDLAVEGLRNKFEELGRLFKKVGVEVGSVFEEDVDVDRAVHLEKGIEDVLSDYRLIFSDHYEDKQAGIRYYA